jgi:hypothetical protein
VARIDATGHEGPTAGAVHARVSLALEVVVDRAGAASRQVATEHGPENDGQPRPGWIGDKHRRHGRHEEQTDDPRLGERQVVASDTDGGGATVA